MLICDMDSFKYAERNLTLAVVIIVVAVIVIVIVTLIKSIL